MPKTLARALALKQHPLGALVPPMTAEERRELIASVKAHGVQVPVVTYEDKILDGASRVDVACELDAEIETVPYTGTDPVGFVTRANLTRRHLTPGQRAEIAVRMRKALEDAGATRRGPGRPTRAEKTCAPAQVSDTAAPDDATCASAQVSEAHSDAAIARETGVSRKTVARVAKRVAAEADPDAAAATKAAKDALIPKKPSKVEQLQERIVDLQTALTAKEQRIGELESTVRFYEDQQRPQDTPARLAEVNNLHAQLRGQKAEIATERRRFEDTIRKLRAENRALRKAAA